MVTLVILDVRKLETSFSVTMLNPEGSMHKIRASELMEAHRMECLITQHAALIRAKDTQAAATNFTSWFSRVALALQYTLSVNNTALDFSLSNLTVCLVPGEHYSRICFRLHRWHDLAAPDDPVKRPDWRRQVLEHFYRETALPLLRKLSEVTGLHINQLWGQLPTYFNYYMDTFVEQADKDIHKQRLIEDYQYLKAGLTPAVFDCAKNPFDVKIRWVEHIKHPDQKSRLKNSCCLYYRTEGGNYCYTCPRLKEEERAMKRLTYRRTLAVQEKQVKV